MKRIFLIFALLLFSINCFSQSRYISETTKKVVYTRDIGKCQCCGSSLNLEYDHIIPFFVAVVVMPQIFNYCVKNAIEVNQIVAIVKFIIKRLEIIVVKTTEL